MRHAFKNLSRVGVFFFPKFLIRTKVTVEMQGYVWVIYRVFILNIQISPNFDLFQMLKSYMYNDFVVLSFRAYGIGH